MPTSRRDFLRYAAAGAAVGLGWPAGTTIAHPVPSSQSLKILVLGGTGFIGPHLVQHILDRGHVPTLFNRGRTNTHLFPDVEKLVGDRAGDLESLKGRTWDAVIDDSASNPTWVRDSAQLLKDAVGTYLFTSTRSVYADFSTIGMDVEGPVYQVDRAWVDEGRQLSYGPAKALCEIEANAAMPGRTLIVRPGLIVGPGDPTDRFTYWPVRLDAGGEVLAPGDPGNRVMFIDVRDLAEWYVQLLERGATGVLNALGPAAPLTYAEFLYGIRAITSMPLSFTWVDTDFLLEREVRPYTDLPLWMPARGDRVGFNRFDLTRSLKLGITYRPLAVTAYDTLEYHNARPADQRARLRAGLESDRERALLAGWHTAQPSGS
jgi:2'-hydroxyisoflavone reductase